ncbi:MAG: type IV pilin protein [Halioglobus sp.]
MKTIIRGNQGGFTLIELMIVVVIVAILLAIALPGFQDQVIRGHRAAAQAQMLDIANREQQFLLANRTYANKTLMETNGYTLPPEVAAHYGYAVTVALLTIPTFNITFTPTGRQAKDGALTLDHLGNKGRGLDTDSWD